MGEYADDYFQREVKAKFGFDPGPNSKPPAKRGPNEAICPKCQKRVKMAGLADHLRTVHHTKEQA